MNSVNHQQMATAVASGQFPNGGGIYPSNVSAAQGNPPTAPQSAETMVAAGNPYLPMVTETRNVYSGLGMTKRVKKPKEGCDGHYCGLASKIGVGVSIVLAGSMFGVASTHVGTAYCDSSSSSYSPGRCIREIEIAESYWIAGGAFAVLMVAFAIGSIAAKCCCKGEKPAATAMTPGQAPNTEAIHPGYVPTATAMTPGQTPDAEAIHPSYVPAAQRSNPSAAPQPANNHGFSPMMYAKL